MTPQEPAAVDQTPEAEGKFHNYVSNRIPWYVRLIWLLFWCFAVAYVVSYLIPDIQRTLMHPQ